MILRQRQLPSAILSYKKVIVAFTKWFKKKCWNMWLWNHAYVFFLRTYPYFALLACQQSKARSHCIRRVINYLASTSSYCTSDTRHTTTRCSLCYSNSLLRSKRKNQFFCCTRFFHFLVGFFVAFYTTYIVEGIADCRSHYYLHT